MAVSALCLKLWWFCNSSNVQKGQEMKKEIGLKKNTEQLTLSKKIPTLQLLKNGRLSLNGYYML